VTQACDQSRAWVIVCLSRRGDLPGKSILSVLGAYTSLQKGTNMAQKDSPVFDLEVDRRVDCWNVALKFTLCDKDLQRAKSLLSGILVPFVISGAGLTLANYQNGVTTDHSHPGDVAQK